ncbi:MAG: hypothetical protein RJB08_1909 [Actinomycetota bacterium]
MNGEIRRDIEGLRAIAVVSVILYHAHFLGLRGGFVGVDVFFVISGFLITTLLVKEHSATGRISLPRFYGRRARRLLPASAVVIVGTLLAANKWLEPLRLRDLGSDAISSGAFVANIGFARRGTDYLQSALPPSALQHYWSLAVEEQFYVVWPALLSFLMWKKGPSHKRALLGILTISVASFVICVWQTSASQPWAFFGLHARAWELGMGALLALGWKSVEHLTDKLRATISWVGIVVIVGSFFVIDESMRFPGVVAIAPVLGSVLVLMGGDSARRGPVMVLRTPVLQWIGSRSYSLYLWHWPVLIIGEAALDGSPNPIERIGLLAIAVVGADLSYRIVENPIRRARLFVQKNRAALVLGVALVATSITAGVIVRGKSVTLATDEIASTPTFTVAPTTTAASSTSSLAPTTIASPTTLPGETTTTSTPGPLPQIVSPTEPLQAIIDAVDAESVPKNLEPSIAGASGDKPALYDNGCHLDAGSTEPGDCVFGDTTSNFTVALFGDSHAAQWFTSLDSIAKQRGWRLLALTKLGCTPIDEITYNSTVGATYPQCRPWRENVKKRLVAERAAVVFVSYSNRLLQVGSHQPFPDNVWIDGFAKLIPELRAGGTEPILITDTPYPGSDVPICLSKNVSHVRNCTFSRAKGINDSRHAANIAAAVNNAAQVLDVSNWLCAADRCPVIFGNVLIYRDSNHITTKFADVLTPLIDAAVSPYVEAVRQRTNVS